MGTFFQWIFNRTSGYHEHARLYAKTVSPLSFRPTASTNLGTPNLAAVSISKTQTEHVTKLIVCLGTHICGRDNPTAPPGDAGLDEYGVSDGRSSGGVPFRLHVDLERGGADQRRISAVVLPAALPGTGEPDLADHEGPVRRGPSQFGLAQGMDHCGGNRG